MARVQLNRTQYGNFVVDGDSDNREDGDWDFDTKTGGHGDFARLTAIAPQVAQAAVGFGLAPDTVFTTAYGSLIALSTEGILPNGRHDARSHQIAVYEDKTGWTC